MVILGSIVRADGGQFMFGISDNNFKNALLEIAQQYFGVERPHYIHFDYGPHHSKVFRCICIFNQQMTSSFGRTKIEAEQGASQLMLSKLQGLHFKRVNDAWIFSITEDIKPLSSTLLALLAPLKHDPSWDVLSLYGDAVMRYIIAQYLYDQYAGFAEGLLTLITAEALKEETRATIARHLQLAPYVRTTATARTLASTLSAVIGKLRLGASDALVDKLILEHYQPFIDYAAAKALSDLNAANQTFSVSATIKTTIHNFKNELQEYAQQRGIALPIYQLMSREGIDHAPIFKVQCLLHNRAQIGQGKTIKSAEQEAARQMLSCIRLDDGEQARLVSRSKDYGRARSSRADWDDRDLAWLRRSLVLPKFVSDVHLKQAFTHASVADDHYQRLEFLGDAILRMVLIDGLLRWYPEVTDKHVLSPWVDRLVSAETQLKIAKNLRLCRYIQSSTQVTDSMLGDVLEALIAAIYIDAQAHSLKASVHTAVLTILDWFQSEIRHSVEVQSLGTQSSTAMLTAFSDSSACTAMLWSGSRGSIPNRNKAVTVSNHEDFPMLNTSARHSNRGSVSKNTRSSYASAVARPKRTFKKS